MKDNNQLLADSVYGIIEDGALEGIKEFIRKHNIENSVNSFIDTDGLTPYLKAAEYGHVEIYDYLASLPNFNVHKRDNNNYDALFLALIRGKTRMFDNLVKKHGFKRDHFLWQNGHIKLDPIYYAVQIGDKKMVEHLLSNYLYTASEGLIEYSNKFQRSEISNYLRQLQDLNQQLSAEIIDHNLENFRKICEEKGAKPKSATQNLAEFAALNGAKDIFEYLVDEHSYDFGLNFLVLGSLPQNDLALLETLLLKYDFNPDEPLFISDQGLINLYQYCEKYFDNEASKHLKYLRSENQKFSQAVADRNHKVALEIFSEQKLYKKTINDSALQCAINGDLELYKKITEENNKFEKTTQDSDQKTILFHAAVSGNTEFVDYLIEEQGFSFDNESKNQLFTAVLNHCEESKKAAMVSHLIKKDIGFIFADDRSEFLGISEISKTMPLLAKDSWASYSSLSQDRLHDYSKILQNQNSEVTAIVSQAQKEVRKIFHQMSRKDLTKKSEQEIIELFEQLGETTENPYKLIKYLFKKESSKKHLEYFDFAKLLTKHDFGNLYSKIAINEPELRADQNLNTVAFFLASQELALEQNLNQPQKYSSDQFRFFEFAVENFGDASQINYLLFDMLSDNSFLEEDLKKSRIYLQNFLNSGRVKNKSYDDEEIVSCIVPKAENLKIWQASDPAVFYSFQSPNKESFQEFKKEERAFFNAVVAKSSQDLLVPVKEIKLSEEEILAAKSGKLDKNIFFLAKADISGSAQYPYTKKDKARNEVYYKVIVLPLKTFKDTHNALHQLAIGIADLKHPSFYGSFDVEPNCDFGITNRETVMSHICSFNDISNSCFNFVKTQNGETKNFKEVAFRNSDIKAMAQSLLKQYPQLSQKAIDMQNARESCSADKIYFSNSQIFLASLVLLSLATYLFRNFNKPNQKIEKPSSPHKLKTPDPESKGKV